MRTELPVAELTDDQAYRLLAATVVPRPIAWVSTRSADGVDNLAPHSFFTVSSTSPPVVQFTSTSLKDTLRNVRATGEFVVCLAPESMQSLVNESGTDFPSQISEFDALGIAREPSVSVAPPRVADSPVALECRLHQLVEVGSATVVMGRVQHVALATEVIAEHHGNLHPQIELMRPLARLGRNQWARLGETVEVPRESYDARVQRLGAEGDGQPWAGGGERR